VADAVSLPVVAGVNTTPTLQEAPAARLAAHGRVAPAETAKSVEFVPDTTTGRVKAIAAFVLFVMVRF
jgi:hypothetical protein